MKQLRFLGLSLLLGIFMSVTLMATPAVAVGNEKKDDVNSLYKWMQTLPPDLQVSVENVMNQNVSAFTDEASNSISDLPRFKESLFEDVRMLLTDEQYKKFVELSSSPTVVKENQLSGVKVCGGDCSSLSLNMNYAWNNIDAALWLFDPDQYNCGNSGDTIGLAISLARFYLNKAKDYADDAYVYCDCASAGQAEHYAADHAMPNLNTALTYTLYNCDSTNPWYNKVWSAKNYAQLAIARVPGCEALACD